MAVLDLIRKGRLKASTFDVKNSPISQFFIENLGYQQVLDHYDGVQGFISGDITSLEFLGLLPLDTLLLLIEGLKKMAPIRRELLNKLAS